MMTSMGRGWTRTVALGALALAAGCSRGGVEDGRYALGSQAMVSSADHKAVYVALADEGAVVRVDLEVGVTSQVLQDGEPTRVARVGNRILVTLRTQRSLLELEDVNETLVERRRVLLGTEPVGVVATEDGARVYVALSTEGRVLELEGTTLAPLRAWTFPSEPRWLAVHPGGGALYVGSAGAPGVSFIDLDSGASRTVGVPTFQAFTNAAAPELVPLTPRVTGDLSVSPQGDLLAVPMLYVENTSALAEPDESNPEPIPSEGYGGRLNPVLTFIPLGEHGVPEDARAMATFTGSFEATGYPSGVTFTPDGEYVVATLEGSAAVSVLRPDDLSDLAGFPSPRGELPLQVQVLQFDAPGGPRAVAFQGDRQAVVYGFLEGQVAPLDLTPLHSGVPFWLSGEVTGRDVSPVSLPADVKAGRRLFYTTSDTRMAVQGSGVSCATCHFEGRDDGLTWVFARGPRQTPSLAGLVSLRAPVRWSGDVATVAEDAMSTSQGFMGGRGLHQEDAEKIAAYIDFVRAVDQPGLHGEPLQIARGQAIFEREDVGCAGCHSGPLYTDKALYGMFGFQGVKTPSLLGVAVTAPYLHDGRAATLRDVLLLARGGAMGDTSSLSEAELDDLEAFLRSL
jgi:DNA-binding beta-propeller fold protein YncE/mono/diheme cytochrome c family protein